jgi:hypothetical protein
VFTVGDWVTLAQALSARPNAEVRPVRSQALRLFSLDWLILRLDDEPAGDHRTHLVDRPSREDHQHMDQSEQHKGAGAKEVQRPRALPTAERNAQEMKASVDSR